MVELPVAGRSTTMYEEYDRAITPDEYVDGNNSRSTAPRSLDGVGSGQWDLTATSAESG